MDLSCPHTGRYRGAMTKPDDQQTQDDLTKGEQVLLEHTIRCWEAEVENAARYERERRLLLTAILAIVGFGTYKLFSTDADRGWFIACMFWPFAIFSALAFIASFVNVIQGRQVTQPHLDTQNLKLDAVTSSFQLRLPDDIVGGYTFLDHIDALRLSRDRTYEAFIDLQERNAEIKANIRKAGSLFIYALSFALIASIILLLGTWLAADNAEADRKEPTHDQQRITQQAQNVDPDQAQTGIQREPDDQAVDAEDGSACK